MGSKYMILGKTMMIRYTEANSPNILFVGCFG